MTGRRPGFTLLELLIVVVVIGLLASIGVRYRGDLVERARVSRAATEIRALELDIGRYQLVNNALPPNLAAIDRDGFPDPWGNPYVYAPLAGSGGDVSAARKDRFLVPINSDFDLYSKGRDGQSFAPLTAKASHDDVIRAADGAYVGIASGY